MSPTVLTMPFVVKGSSSESPVAFGSYASILLGLESRSGLSLTFITLTILRIISQSLCRIYFNFEVECTLILLGLVFSHE